MGDPYTYLGTHGRLTGKRWMPCILYWMPMGRPIWVTYEGKLPVTHGRHMQYQQQTDP